MGNVWVVTSEWNRYDQEGAYFICVFLFRPTPEELQLSGFSATDAAHIATGGGRRGTEDQWYNLEEVELGTKYGH